MPDAGERREITRFVDAKEAEVVHESKRLVLKTLENRSRKQRNVSAWSEQKPRETEDHRRDPAASERTVDEGDPNPRP